MYENIKNENIITIPKGSTYEDTVLVEHENGDPFVFTGYTVRSHLRTLSGALVGTFTCNIPLPDTGVVERALSVEETSLLNPEAHVTHVWGVEITETATGKVLPEIQGGAMIGPEVVL